MHEDELADSLAILASSAEEAARATTRLAEVVKQLADAVDRDRG